MTQLYIYIPLAFIIGFAVAWLLRTQTLVKTNKLLKSAQGFLESESLKKETLQKENLLVHQAKQSLEMESEKKLQKALGLIKRLDEDILLLQQSNEETEKLLAEGQPAVHALKLQLIEANNNLLRMKAMLEAKR